MSSWKDSARKLGYREVVSMRERLEMLESQFRPQVRPSEDGLVSMEKLLQNSGDTKTEISNIRKTLEKDAALIIRAPGQKLKARREVGELEQKLKEFAPTYREQKTMYKQELDFERAVNHSVVFTQRCQKDVERWKELMRRLEPEDPTADRVERLFAGWEVPKD